MVSLDPRVHSLGGTVAKKKTQTNFEMGAKKTKAVVAANPASAIGSVGAFFAVLGGVLNWSPETIAAVSSLFLAAIPAVKGVIFLFQTAEVEEAEEE